jgi:signal transduction histidine kinase
MWQVIPAFIFGALVAGLIAWQICLRRTRRQHENEDELLRRTRRAEKLAEMGAMTGGLAHEIRNPLSTIKMNLQLLSEDMSDRIKQLKGSPAPDAPDHAGLDDPARIYQRHLRRIDTIKDEADRLTETLNDFLRYAGKIELHPVSCDVNELLDDLVDFYEPQALHHNVQIRRSLDACEATCRVDADLLKQAFLNLFINATQAMADGGELIVRSSSTADTVRIDIIDTGPGIVPDLQDKIFDAYFTTRAGGTGLGLPTCRRIIEEHHGTIELISEPGKGSNFVVVLPRKKD